MHKYKKSKQERTQSICFIAASTISAIAASIFAGTSIVYVMPFFNSATVNGVSDAVPLPLPATIAGAIVFVAVSFICLKQAATTNTDYAVLNPIRAAKNAMRESKLAAVRNEQKRELGWMHRALDPVSYAFGDAKRFREEDMWRAVEKLSCGHPELVPSHPACEDGAFSVMHAVDGMESWKAKVSDEKKTVSAIVSIWNSCLHGAQLDLRATSAASIRKLGETCGAAALLECYASGIPIEDVLGHEVSG